jgi:hypothetical protein
MRKSVWREFIHLSPDKTRVLPAKTYGNFFPEMYKDPKKYIMLQPELRTILETLRDQGKFIFLGTNSHFDYMELIMSTTLGEDWRSFFNMVFCDCRKPNFFKGEAVMFEADPQAKNFKG